MISACKRLAAVATLTPPASSISSLNSSSLNLLSLPLGRRFSRRFFLITLRPCTNPLVLPFGAPALALPAYCAMLGFPLGLVGFLSSSWRSDYREVGLLAFKIPSGSTQKLPSLGSAVLNFLLNDLGAGELTS